MHLDSASPPERLAVEGEPGTMNESTIAPAAVFRKAKDLVDLPHECDNLTCARGPVSVTRIQLRILAVDSLRSEGADPHVDSLLSAWLHVHRMPVHVSCAVCQTR